MTAPPHAVPPSAAIHGVRLYDDEGLLSDALAEYVGAGLAAGERVCALIAAQRWELVAARLADNAFDVPRALASGRLTVQDSRGLLAGMKVGASLDPQRLREAIDEAVVTDGPPPRVCADLADVLRQEGDLAGALQLEDLWDELLREDAFRRICAFAVGPADAERTGSGPDGARNTQPCRAIEGLVAQAAPPSDEHLSEIGALQRRARALESELRQRKELETALRDAIHDRERLLAEVETDRARLGESEVRQVIQRRRLELLQSITASFARALEPRDIAAVIVDEGSAAVGAPRAGIWLLAADGKSLELVRSSGLPVATVEASSRVGVDAPDPVARCYATRAAVWRESRADLPDESRPAPLDDPANAEAAYALLPLVVERRCFGVFGLSFSHARKLGAEERTFLVTLAHHAAQALERARLFEDAQRVEAAQRFLSEASAVLAGSLDHEATLAAVTRLAVPRMADWASIDMLSADGSFRRVAVAHVDPAKVELGWELSRRHPPSSHDVTGPGQVVRTGEPELFEDISEGLRRRVVQDGEILEVIRALGLVSSVCVPLTISGRAVGAMTLVSAESGRHFAAPDLALAEELARRASMAIGNARAYREAQEANRLKDDFLATMSHELRTPLNAILGWSSMLRARPGLDVQKAVATIERNARAQVRLIEEVLDISRIMTGKLRLEARSMDLASVVRASIDVIAPSAQAKNIALTIEVQAEPFAFHGDAGRLQQVCWNLLSNAIKFTPKGGRVRVRLERAGSEAQIIVEDDGRGIRGDFLPVVFQRFRQADSSTTRTEGGLGIGLAIVGHLVELHGGTVTAHSEGEGKGAMFVVRVPVRAVALDERQPAPTLSVDRKLLAGLRVLICEDDVDSRELLQEALSIEGAVVRAASAADEAIDHLREFQPHVLVSDIGLPVVDGYTLIRQIRAMDAKEGGRVPAIALTAYASAEDARRAFAAGYQVHVTKPVDPHDLATRVATLAGSADGAGVESR